MTSHVKLRKEKVGIVDYDVQVKEVRSQLIEQLKVLDLQLEVKTQQLQDLTEYLRRRGEIESEYARSLEKLTEKFTSRIKRKEPSTNSVSQMWMALLSHTRQESKDHSGLSESCNYFLTQPLIHCLEYTQRISRKSKDICTQLQDGLLKVTTELQTAWRTYHQYYSDFICAEGKLKEAEKQEEKQKHGAAKKLERLIEKRQLKVQEIHLKTSKARNDYLLNLAATNSSMTKYYLQDISSLIDFADVGYHLSLSRVMHAYLFRRERGQLKLSSSLQQLRETVSGLDQSRDRNTLLQDHYNTFSMPVRYTYQPQEGDQISEISVECEMWCELETRFKQIQTRLKAVTEETEEVRKSMVAAQSSLVEGIVDDDLDPSSGCVYLQEGSSESLTVKPSMTKRRANLQEIENLFYTKVKDYLVGSSLICKLQSKHDLLKVAVEKESMEGNQARSPEKFVRIRKTPSGTNVMRNHKLFNGDLLSYIQATGQQIPLVVDSCIRFINLNGLHHEGIFRVPGSQVEVNNLKEAFEEGINPLAEKRYDLDSVAGVLKLYFRGLENPLFPSDSTGQLLEFAQMKNEAERAAQLKAAISSYPRPIIIVMRYLFAFLHHVSQYSDENMMQPYNLAVCFGPSLVRDVQDDDFVTLQPQINLLVKHLIVQHETIFPSENELDGPRYEKCMTLELDDGEPVIEETELEADSTYEKIGSENGSPADNVTQLLLSPGLPAERFRTYSGGCMELTRPPVSSTGNTISTAGKLLLQIPTGPQMKPKKSPTNARKEFQSHPAFEDVAHVDQEVCRQMESVFRELLSRKSPKDLSPTGSTSAAKAPLKKGKRGPRKAL